MTVKEAIEKLQKMPQDSQLVIESNDLVVGSFNTRASENHKFVYVSVIIR
jgi:hypothetical protein